LGGLIGYGTEYVVLTLCLLGGSVGAYLWCSLLMFNVIWLGDVLYRRFVAV
jgi:hypothetical protein